MAHPVAPELAPLSPGTGARSGIGVPEGIAVSGIGATGGTNVDVDAPPEPEAPDDPDEDPDPPPEQTIGKPMLEISDRWPPTRSRSCVTGS